MEVTASPLPDFVHEDGQLLAPLTCVSDTMHVIQDSSMHFVCKRQIAMNEDLTTE